MEGFFAHGTRGHIWIDNIHMSLSAPLTECTRKSRRQAKKKTLQQYWRISEYIYSRIVQFRGGRGSSLHGNIVLFVMRGVGLFGFFMTFGQIFTVSF